MDSMIRIVANNLIRLYLLPFKYSPRLNYYVRDVFFTSGAEHLYRATKHIKKSGHATESTAIVDVGAFNGATALYFAGEFPEARIYAIEPNPQMASTLRDIAKQHQSIFVKNIALGRLKQEATLHLTSNGVSSSINELNAVEIEKQPPQYRSWLKEESAMKVQVSTLDEEFKDAANVLLIKLDTQGTELDVLEGGVETLKRTRFVLAEMNNHQMYKNTAQYYEVDECLRRNQFRLVDTIVSYRAAQGVTEYDALYENKSL